MKCINNICSLVSFGFLLVITFLSCHPAESQSPYSLPSEFNDYWYSGEAELTRYDLQQARYGEIHKGEAVLIFVTEEFRKDKQVKYEGGDRKNVVPILKLNFTKKFNTGIYPYSLMSSIFTPTSGDKTIKVSTTTQEWCGHTFSQFNLKGNKYQGQLFSYFQEEGDQNIKVEGTLLEDEIWTKIRLNPESLPTGEFQIIPGSQFQRLAHTEIQSEKAIAAIRDIEDSSLSNSKLKAYELTYQNVNRKLTIFYEAQFPHQIVKWTEEVASGYGSNRKTLTTIATKTHQIKSAYWGKNGVVDLPLREKLGLQH
ncbi:MAG: hypothetical protein AAGA77_11585 [Bacteroidota bacterium]